MEWRHIADVLGRRAWFGELKAPWKFESPFSGEQFVVMLVVHDINIPCDVQETISSALVSQGCRFAVCTGFAAATWSASIELAHISTNPNINPPDTTSVMTTSHENEPLDTTVAYLFQATSFDDFVPRNFLILFLGHDAQAEQEVVRAVDDVIKKQTTV